MSLRGYYTRPTGPNIPPLALIGTNTLDSYPPVITFTGHPASGKSVQLLGVWQRAVEQAAMPVIFVDGKRCLRKEALELVPPSRRQSLIELSELDVLTLPLDALNHTSLVYVAPTTLFAEPSPFHVLQQFISRLAAISLPLRPLLLVDEAQVLVDPALVQALHSAQMTTILASQSPLPGVGETAWSYAMWTHQGPADGEPAGYPALLHS